MNDFKKFVCSNLNSVMAKIDDFNLNEIQTRVNDFSWSELKENLNKSRLLQRATEGLARGPTTEQSHDRQDASNLQLQQNGRIAEYPVLNARKGSEKVIPFSVPSSPFLNYERYDNYREDCGNWNDVNSKNNNNDIAQSVNNNNNEEPKERAIIPVRRRCQSANRSVAAFSSFACRGGFYNLGSLDPSLYGTRDYSDEEYEMSRGHIGRIWLAVEYERDSEKLLVNLIGARNLLSRASGSGSSCDPFVRIYLMPDERRYLQSSFKRKTCNPKYDEDFVFQISNKALSERSLKVTVYDVDRHKRHVIIGHAIYSLKDCRQENGGARRVVIWRDLEREVTECSVGKGDLHMSLCYNDHLERLTVGIFEGKDFHAADSTHATDFYVKVCLLIQGKVVKAKKTDVVRQSRDPTFNESFTFKLPANSLEAGSVTVTVLQNFIGQRDKLIGTVVVGSFMFARGKELEHWNEMQRNIREQICQWHPLT